MMDNVATLTQIPTMTPAPVQDIFHRLRTPEEINLIEEVRKALREVGLMQVMELHYDTDPAIIQAEPLCPEAQRYFLNQYWNLQLLASGKPSADQRYCLINQGSFLDWMRLFRQVVRPFCMEHGLPKAL